MAEKEYFIDDRVIIPDWVKNMTSEERWAEIRRLEAEAREEKRRILESMKKDNT
ncbi:MAG: hypothetical protein K2N56_04455 [Oscillospiraceae bacterium]|nr:hypothetical protein [Oscillospiraceae bacterium]